MNRISIVDTEERIARNCCGGIKARATREVCRDGIGNAFELNNYKAVAVIGCNGDTVEFTAYSRALSVDYNRRVTCCGNRKIAVLRGNRGTRAE